MRILNLIGPEYSAEAKKILNRAGKVDYPSLKNQTQLKKIIHRYDIAVIGLAFNFDRNVIDCATRLKIIATASTGADHIDLDYAREKGIKVLSLKNDRAFLDKITGTAELAFLLILALSRNFLPATQSALKYHWTNKFRGRNLSEKTLGIVGLGRLGTMVARFGQAFGMKVIAHDPFLEKKVFDRSGCRRVSFSGLLKASDIISIHVHLNEKTQNLFGEKAFSLMKKTAFLVNTSRGKVVNEKDLLRALEKGEIAGYGTDVLADELTFGNKFEHNELIEYVKNHSNVVITPHVGGVTFESREATDIFTARKVLKELKNNI